MNVRVLARAFPAEAPCVPTCRVVGHHGGAHESEISYVAVSEPPEKARPCMGASDREPRDRPTPAVEVRNPARRRSSAEDRSPLPCQGDVLLECEIGA